MREYRIYSGPWAATGESGGPTYHGTAIGTDFKNACMKFANTNPDFAQYFDPERMTYWGCRLAGSLEEF